MKEIIYTLGQNDSLLERNYFMENRIFERLMIFEGTVFFKNDFLQVNWSLQDISFVMYPSKLMGDKDQKANVWKACKPFTIIHEQFGYL